MNITLGTRNDQPRGTRKAVGDVLSFSCALTARPADDEHWWSPHVWQGDKRATSGWEACCALALDLDYRNTQGEHTAPPSDVAEGLKTLALSGALGGTLFHSTPRGARLVFIFGEPVTDANTYMLACEAVASQVEGSLPPGYEVDRPALLDRARLLYSPRSKVRGEAAQRNAVVHIVGPTCDGAALADSFWPKHPTPEQWTPPETRDELPGVEFAARTTWAEILKPHGWEQVASRNGVLGWRRPGKDRGISATTNYADSDLLYVFSTSTQFKAKKTYTKFGAYTVFTQGGETPEDHSAAAAQLAKEGYGDDKNKRRAAKEVRQPKKDTSTTLLVLSTVTPSRVRWVWPGRIPAGKLTLWDGDPSLGKSLATLDLAARVSRGGLMPDGTRGDLHEPKGVVLLNCEDDPADTIRPRLDLAGADCTKIALLQGVKQVDRKTRDEFVALPTLEDVEAIEAAIKQTDAALVVIDPLMAYLTGDSHVDQEVRKGMAPITDLAARTGVAIVIVRHLNKSGGANAMYRGGGSIGIIGAARSALLVAKDPDDPTGERRIVAVNKSNLAPTHEALAYHVEAIDGVPKVVWEGTSKHTANTLLAIPTEAAERPALTEAKDFLREAMENGECRASELYRLAEEAGIPDKRVKEACKALRVSKDKIGRPGEKQWWEWHLPKKPVPPDAPLWENLHSSSFSGSPSSPSAEDEDSSDDSEESHAAPFGTLQGAL